MSAMRGCIAAFEIVTKVGYGPKSTFLSQIIAQDFRNLSFCVMSN